MEEVPRAVYKTAPLAAPAAVRIYENEIEVMRPGLTRQTTQRFRYGQIAQVAVRRGVAFATLVIESTGGHTATVSGMLRGTAEEARSVIEERMNLATSAAEASSSLTYDVPAQIRELAKLKEAGLISETEYEAKKKNLLDRM
jgi:Short C-terminal domain